MANVLQQCKTVLWDECTMAHKNSLLALNRTLKDLRGNHNIFGSALVLLAGDFRNNPVIPKAMAADEMNACLKSSDLWRYVKTLKLTPNMRVELQNDQPEKVFSKQLMDIGNGKIPAIITNGFITLPGNFCSFIASKEELIQKVFPDIVPNNKNHN